MEPIGQAEPSTFDEGHRARPQPAARAVDAPLQERNGLDLAVNDADAFRSGHSLTAQIGLAELRRARVELEGQGGALSRDRNARSWSRQKDVGSLQSSELAELRQVAEGALQTAEEAQACFVVRLPQHGRQAAHPTVLLRGIESQLTIGDQARFVGEARVGQVANVTHGQRHAARAETNEGAEDVARPGTLATHEQ